VVIFAETKGKKDDQHEDKEPSEVHGGVQGESRHGSTTVADKKAYKYPYLLKGLDIDHRNQVWELDISYIPMRRGYMYLFAIIDVYLSPCETGDELWRGLDGYFRFYNDERLHQSLGYKTPASRYLLQKEAA